MLRIVKGGEYKAKILLGEDKDRSEVDEKNFATEDEAKAYIEGMFDGEGWLAIEEVD